MARRPVRVPARAHPVLESLVRARARIETAWGGRDRRLAPWGPGARSGLQPRRPRARPVGDDPARSLDLLAELGRRLGPGDAEQFLPDTARWLSEALGTHVVFVVVGGGGPGRAFGWPPDATVLAELATLADGTAADRGSILHQALEEGRTVHAPVARAGLSLLHPSGPGSGVGSLAVVPLAVSGRSEGALILHSPEPAAIGPRLIPLAEEVAARVGLVLANARLRAELAELVDAQEAAHLREELLAALSHDMQTPLAVLLGSIKALQAVDDLAPKHRAGLYESMARRGAQLHRLVEQFLDYSRLEAGRPIQVRPGPTDVAAAIARVETEVGWRRPLEMDVPDDLPPAFVDPDRLDQVLTNLISNAVKFSPVGSPITVEVRAGDDTVEVAIEDRGRGMSPAELERAFLKFHRGAGAEDTPGTGLGLYVSRAVIEAQGGRLLAESRLDHGSRFTVVLPRTGQTDDQGPEADDQDRGSRT